MKTEDKIIEILKDIGKYSYNSHCDCISCKKIRVRIRKVLEEK